ncbi:MAG: tetratricopeptide repeat protein [Rhodothermales bacterium]
MNFLLCNFITLLILIPGAGYAQPVQIDERFGIELQFSDRFQKLSETLYSPHLQSQLFSTNDEELFVFVAKFPGLGTLEKQQWAKGMSGHPLSSADEVTELMEENWPFAKPVLSTGFLGDSTSGMSVFLTRQTHDDSVYVASYVIFLANHNAYVQMIASITAKEREIDLSKLSELMSTAEFVRPVQPDDIYAQAEHAYFREKDPVSAGKLYDLVRADHPMYAEAQRRLGYSIKGSEFGDWGGAVGHVEEAFRLEPDDEAVIKNLGRVYLKTDKYAEGVALLEKAGEDERILKAGNAGPDMLIGTFEDDYAVPYTIKKGVIYQHTSNTYHIKYWNNEEQYLIAQNDVDNDGGESLWTRIDWIELADMAPYTWAYCLSAYDAKSATEAEEVKITDRSAPRTGCNGFPFSRMKPTP